MFEIVDQHGNVTRYSYAEALEVIEDLLAAGEDGALDIADTITIKRVA